MGILSEFSSVGFLENCGLSISDDYENLAPRKSFIDAKDFTSIEELAQYLIYLDKNEGTSRFPRA